MTEPFWEHKKLNEMTESEWESLCDGCGQCCLHKYISEDTGHLLYSDLACNMLDIHTCRCKDYANRLESTEECLKMTQESVYQYDWLPPTCSYRLLHEGKKLPDWHPLITGSHDEMHQQGRSIRDRVIYVKDITDDADWQNHLFLEPFQ